MDSALNQGLVQEEDIAGINDAMRGRRGCVDMRRWWRLADGRAQSPLETRIRLICQDGGLPPGELQRRFTDQDGGTIAMVDFWWEKARLIGKADELGPHGTPRALVRAWERQNALQKLYPDVRIVRFTWAAGLHPGAGGSGKGRRLRARIRPLRQVGRLLPPFVTMESGKSGRGWGRTETSPPTEEPHSEGLDQLQVLVDELVDLLLVGGDEVGELVQRSVGAHIRGVTRRAWDLE